MNHIRRILNEKDVSFHKFVKLSGVSIHFIMDVERRGHTPREWILESFSKELARIDGNTPEYHLEKITMEYTKK